MKWVSSKMRFVHKMMNSNNSGTENQMIRVAHKTNDQQPADNSTPTISTNYYNCNNTVRVCADCNTTKTPLWRSGPRGPKSLCNACGIRQRKARRAMAAAASGMVVATNASVISKVNSKEKKSRTSNVTQHKKHCKLLGSAQSSGKKLSFEDFAASMGKNSAFRRVIPQDEEEAAILLMALSSGLINS